MPSLRELAFELLEDDHGITQDAWRCLCELFEETDESYEDIALALDGCEGRVFLPEGHGLVC